MESVEISYSQAHPQAQKLMEDDFFYSVVDQNAPFGDDDSWESFMSFRNWLSENKGKDKLEFIYGQINHWGYPLFDLRTTTIEVIARYIYSDGLGLRLLIGIDQCIIATAFGQLYLEGRVDPNLRDLAITALKRQLLPELLQPWALHKEEREEKLHKLLSVIQSTPLVDEHSPK